MNSTQLGTWGALSKTKAAVAKRSPRSSQNAFSQEKPLLLRQWTTRRSAGAAARNAASAPRAAAASSPGDGTCVHVVNPRPTQSAVWSATSSWELPQKPSTTAAPRAAPAGAATRGSLGAPSASLARIASIFWSR